MKLAALKKFTLALTLVGSINNSLTGLLPEEMSRKSAVGYGLIGAGLTATAIELIVQYVFNKSQSEYAKYWNVLVSNGNQYGYDSNRSLISVEAVVIDFIIPMLVGTIVTTNLWDKTPAAIAKTMEKCIKKYKQELEINAEFRQAELVKAANRCLREWENDPRFAKGKSLAKLSSFSENHKYALVDLKKFFMTANAGLLSFLKEFNKYDELSEKAEKIYYQLCEFKTDRIEPLLEAISQDPEFDRQDEIAAAVEHQEKEFALRKAEIAANEQLAESFKINSEQTVKLREDMKQIDEAVKTTSSIVGAVKQIEQSLEVNARVISSSVGTLQGVVQGVSTISNNIQETQKETQAIKKGLKEVKEEITTEVKNLSKKIDSVQKKVEEQFQSSLSNLPGYNPDYYNPDGTEK